MSAQVYLALVPTSANTPYIALTYDLPDANVGAAYSGSITGTNLGGATGAITFNYDVLPAGLTLSDPVNNGDGSYTATISGTPTTGGNVATTFTAANSTQMASLQHTFVVAATSGIAVTMNLPDAQANTPYSGSITGTNQGSETGTITYSAFGLPDGLSIDKTTGAVTGTTGSDAWVNATFTITNGTTTVHPTHVFKIGAPAALPIATITGTLSDGTPINVSCPAGMRVPLIQSSLVGSVVFHSDALTVCIENGYAGLKNDLTGTFTVSVGGTQLWTGTTTLFAYTRSRPWWTAARPLTANPDLSIFGTYGSGSENVSNPDQTKINTSPTPNHTDYSPNGIGQTRNSFGAPGGSSQFGPLPEWDAKWMCNPTANNLAAAFNMTEGGCCWGPGAVVIDPKTNKMLRVHDYAKVTLDGNQWGVFGNPIVAFSTKIWNKTTTTGLNFYGVDTHATCYYALACALSPAEYYKESLALWANCVACLYQSWPYRTASGVALYSASRALGRTMRCVMYAALLSNDTEYFLPWMDQYATSLTARYQGQTGVHLDQHNVNIENYNGQHKYAPWQEMVLLNAVCRSVKNGFTGLQYAADYLAEYTFQAVLDNPHEYSTCTELCWRAGDGSAGNTIAADFGDVIKFTLIYDGGDGTVPYPEDSLELIQNIMAYKGPTAVAQYVAGDFAVTPWAADSQAAMQQMALAEAVNVVTDQTRAWATWNKLVARMRTGIFATNPQYNVVPVPLS